MAPKNFLLPSLHNVSVRTRGYIPHWEMPNAVYSITYRLHDSLPRNVVQALNEEHRAIERMYSNGATALDRARIRFAMEHSIDRALDNSYGAAHLRDDRIAGMVVQNLAYFNGSRYELFAWCVMPTHVHIVMRLLGAYGLAAVVHTWKSFTAKRANEILGTAGPFWAREYFDRIVRNEEDLSRTMDYVVRNPVKAGLRDWPWVWSAGEPPADRPASGRRSE